MTQNKHGSHYIWYLVLNVLSMYLTCTLVLASALIHPNRNANHLFELVSYTFLANKLKILYKTLYKRLIEKKWVKHAPGYFLTFCFPFTYIKTSSSKPRPINLWSKLLKIAGKVAYFAPFFSCWNLTWYYNNAWFYNDILLWLKKQGNRYPFALRKTSLPQIFRGRYLHWSMKYGNYIPSIRLT